MQCEHKYVLHMHNADHHYYQGQLFVKHSSHRDEGLLNRWKATHARDRSRRQQPHLLSNLIARLFNLIARKLDYVSEDAVKVTVAYHAPL